MPVPGGELEPNVMLWSELAPEGAHETDKEEDHADNDMRAVKAGRHEESGAIDRILKAERRVDIFVTLGEHEQHAEGDAEREEDLELAAVALAQIVMGDIDRGARRQQHECVHQRQREWVDHLRALRRPDPTTEIEEPVGLGIGGIERVPEKRPEPGEEKHNLRSDEQDHAKGQTMAHDDVVVATLGLRHDIAPPAHHGEQDACHADCQKPRAEARPMHEQYEAEGREKTECRPNKRPRAWLDEMKSRPVRNRRVGHSLLPLLIIPRDPRDRPSAFRPAVRTSYRTA